MSTGVSLANICAQRKKQLIFTILENNISLSDRHLASLGHQEAWNPGIWESWNLGILEPWNPGTGFPLLKTGFPLLETGPPLFPKQIYLNGVLTVW